MTIQVTQATYSLWIFQIRPSFNCSIFQLRRVGYADIIQLLGVFFGHVYSTFRICISTGVFTAFCNTQPLACLRSALCLVNKPTSQQFAKLGLRCVTVWLSNATLWGENDICWSREADRVEEWEESGGLFRMGEDCVLSWLTGMIPPKTFSSGANIMGQPRCL